MPPLGDEQRSSILETVKRHEKSLLEKPRRHARLVECVSAETRKDRLSTPWVIGRIEKASGAAYTTGGDPGRRAKFNGKVFDRDGDTHACADISGVYLKDVLTDPRGKVDLKNYSNKKALEAHLEENVPNSRYLALRATSDRAHITQPRNLGRFMARQLREMGVGIRAGFIETATHTMVARLRKKKPAPGVRPHVACVFDPAFTNRHRRIERSDARDLARLGLRDFIAADRLSLYLGDADEACVIFMHHWDSPSVDDRGLSRVIPCTIEGPWTSYTLAHVLEGNLALDVSWAIEQLEALEPEERVATLQTAMPGRNSGLYLGIMDGHVEGVRAFGRLLLSTLADQRCAAVAQGQLASWLDVGGKKHALFRAMENGHDSTVQAYGDIVIEAYERGHLSAVELQGLLASSDGNGRTALFAAAASKNAGFSDTYLRLIRRVPAGQRAPLLSMTTRGGKSGIAKCLLAGDAKPADRALRILRQAHGQGLITARELAKLSMTTDLLETWEDGFIPGHAHKVFADHVQYVGACLERESASS